MELEQVYRYIDPYSILVITPQKLIRKHCPFYVKPYFSFDSLSADTSVIVSKVMLDKDKKLVYIIDGQGYSYRLFSIV